MQGKRITHYCPKCGGNLTKNPRDYYNCLACGMVGSIDEMESKASIYNLRLINDTYNRYGKGNGKMSMPWFMQQTFKTLGVELKKCILQ